MIRNIIEEVANAPGSATSFATNGPTTGRMPWIHAQTFASLDVVFYGIEGPAAGTTKIEWGIGKVTAGPPTIFERTQVIANSDGTTTRINFTGPVRVYNEIPAEHAVYTTPAGLLRASPQQIGGAIWGTITGGPNALAIATPHSTTLKPGAMILCSPISAPTGQVTVDINGAGAVPLYSSERRRQVKAGDWSAGALLLLAYDGADWRLVNPIEPGLIPVGTLVQWTTPTLPPGFLYAAGQNVSRVTYSKLNALYASASYPFGTGDGSSTFGVPDARGRALFGRDDMGASAASRITAAISGINGALLGASGGDQRLQSHTHPIGIPAAGYVLVPATPQSVYVLQGDGATYNSATGAAGAGASQNMPPALICDVLVYAGE